MLGADVKKQDDTCSTPLAVASNNGHSETVRVLLQFGAGEDLQPAHNPNSASMYNNSTSLPSLSLSLPPTSIYLKPSGQFSCHSFLSLLFVCSFFLFFVCFIFVKFFLIFLLLLFFPPIFTLWGKYVRGGGGKGCIQQEKETKMIHRIEERRIDGGGGYLG